MSEVSSSQIAHDLAIAKLTKEDLSNTKDAISKYHQYQEEFINALDSEPVKTKILERSTLGF